MQTRKPVETELGILWGRDCVFLDHVSMPDLTSLRLAGTINANIVRNFLAPSGWQKSDEIPYRFTFHRCLGFQMLELDTWESQNTDDDALMESSFQELTDSTWLQRLAGKLNSNHRHFQLATYDDVFDIICQDYALSFGDSAA